MDLFDQIFVSINKSPKQEEDIALIRDFPSEKLHWTRQDQSLTAVEHGKRLDRFVASFNPEGHIFILCHDDILLREGLLQLKKLDLKDDEAVFGPFHFFSQDHTLRDMIVREFHREDGSPIEKEYFIYMQGQQQFVYNVSGIVMPMEAFQMKCCPWHLLCYGCFSEHLHLTSPVIKRIYQIGIPTVKIRMHDASEGSRVCQDDLIYDWLLYHMHAFVQCKDQHNQTISSSQE